MRWTIWLLDVPPSVTVQIFSEISETDGSLRDGPFVAAGLRFFVGFLTGWD